MPNQMWRAVLAPFARFGVLPWANAVVNALALLAVYRLGCEFFGAKTSLGALGLGLASPLAWAMGASYLSHPVALLFTTLALLGPTVGLRADRGRWLAASGLAVGALSLVRPWDAVAVAATLVLMLMLTRQRKGILLVVGCMLPFAVALLLYNRALTTSPWLFPQHLYNPRDALGWGSDVGKIATYGSLGHSPIKAVFNLGHNLRSLATNLFGWPFLSLLFIPFAYLTRRPRHRRGLALLSCFAVVHTLAYSLYWYDGVLYGARFYYALMPYFLLLTAAGIGAVHRWLRRLRAAWAVPTLVATLFVFSALVYVPHYVRKLRASYNLMDNEIYAAAREAEIAEGLVLCPPNDRSYPSYGSVFWRNSPWLDTPLVWAKDLGPLNEKLYRTYRGRRMWVYREGRIYDALRDESPRRTR